MFTPLRMCVACREMKPKQELVRLTKTDDGITIDLEKKLQGRGVYVCKSTECVRLAEKKKALQRHFKTAVAADIYHLIEEYCNG